MSVPLRSFIEPLSFDLFATSRSFWLERLSSPSVCRWLELDNVPPPVTDWISSTLLRWDLRYFYFSEVIGFSSPIPAVLINILLRDPTMGERGFVFLKKRRVNRFPASSSPLTQTHPLCPRSCVAEISTLIGFRIPPRRNSPGGISPWFWWSW